MFLSQAARVIIQLIPGSDLRYLISFGARDKYSPTFSSWNCDITVDGFPRTANTFVYYHVQLAFPEIRIAHHIHSWQNIFFAKAFRVPTVLLLRNPDEAVQSLFTKRGGHIGIYYIDYSVTNILSSFFSDDIWLFETLTSDVGIEKLKESVGRRLGIKPAAVSKTEIAALMAERTSHKNAKTPPFDDGQLSFFATVARSIANRVYKRLLRRAK